MGPAFFYCYIGIFESAQVFHIVIVCICLGFRFKSKCSVSLYHYHHKYVIFRRSKYPIMKYLGSE